MTEDPANEQSGQLRLADLFEATVERCGAKQALGYPIGEDRLRWWTWDEIPKLESSIMDDTLHPFRSPGPGWKGLDRWTRYQKVYWFVWSVLQVVGRESEPCINQYDDTPNQWDYPNGAKVISRTAGTSGDTRWVVLSDQNLFSNTIAVANTIAESIGEEDDGDEVRLSFLPDSHLYGLVCDVLCWIYRGSKLVLAESRETVFRDCQLAQPTAINGVPYFFEKAISLADRDGVSLRELLGGRIRRCYSGGAFLAPAVEQRFFDEGIPLLNGYGLSEASPVVTVSTHQHHKLGAVGRPLPGVEVRIAGDGEILVRGPNVMMGYWGPGGIDREATAEVLRDGWLYTGDLGELDSEGFLTITGRKKELIVLSTGKNVAPSRVEAMLCASPWIEQACVFGDSEKGLRALVVPNPERLRAEIRRRRLWVWSKRGALRHKAVRALYREEIDARLADASREEQVHAFTLVGRGFDRERGEMTAKLSLRRGAIAKSFERELAAL